MIPPADRPLPQARAELTRLAAEDFLFHEAALLDTWALEEWLELLTEDVQYTVTMGPSSDPRGTLDGSCLILDDAIRIRSRARQLLGKSAWSERPRSRTRRLVTNVRVVPGASESVVKANFAVHRFANGESTLYVGRYEYVVVGDPHALRIRSRTAWLDSDVLKPYGGLSIIL